MDASGDRQLLHVAAGILTDEQNQVLLAQRPADKHMGGSWEFPGGKIAATETPLQGLVRELHEELAVIPLYCRYLMRYTHDYPDRRVCLYFWKVSRWSGEPSGAEQQALRWVKPEDLLGAGLLKADKPVVAQLLKEQPVNSLQPLALENCLLRPVT